MAVSQRTSFAASTGHLASLSVAVAPSRAREQFTWIPFNQSLCVRNDTRSDFPSSQIWRMNPISPPLMKLLVREAITSVMSRQSHQKGGYNWRRMVKAIVTSLSDAVLAFPEIQGISAGGYPIPARRTNILAVSCEQRSRICALRRPAQNGTSRRRGLRFNPSPASFPLAISERALSRP